MAPSLSWARPAARQPGVGARLPDEGRPAAAAQRPHQQLFRDPAGTRHLRTGHDLPGRQAGHAPPRRRPPQHALPQLQQADGPGRGRGPAGHRHERGDLGIPQRPGRGPPPGAGRQPRRLLPAALVGLHRRHPDSRDGLGQFPGGRPRAVVRQHALLLPVYAEPRPTASCRAGGRRSSRRWPRRTAAT